MARMKELIKVIENWEDLPNSSFKSGMKREMDELKELVNWDDYKKGKVIKSTLKKISSASVGIRDPYA